MYEKYYKDVSSASEKLSQEQAQFKESLDKKMNKPSLAYYQTFSSSYYKESQEKFDKEIKNFESKISGSLSDCKNYCSDLFFSDGYLTNSGRKYCQELYQRGTGGFQNHKFNRYEHYESASEMGAIELPTTQLLQAFSIPIIVSGLCGFFLVNNAQ
eukprot:CAMPEP_0168612720 /NCGR_PEP_ID=MMETSP0449_2-20121227/3066_1 /TAXON_ID=1082188 /ORGANISM="Strombidium rassoulzadegani, Strain ras09" /LENGTH=155 /DNA_ID=CAMNT_0008653301 /DNA_START=573 /DNA_END=1037 /DNA_ORIENTATION=+